MIVLTLLLASIFGEAVSTQAAAQSQPVRARLVFIDTPENCPNMDDLNKCRDLSIEEYRKHNVEVLRKSWVDVERWLMSDGTNFRNAERPYQYIALARSLEADMIGGISYYAADALGAAAPLEESSDTRFNSWGYNLRWCVRAIGPLGKKHLRGEAVPILTLPFQLAERNHERIWSIPTKIEPARPFWGGGPSRISGFDAMIGIKFEPGENRVQRVLKRTPASRLGIAVGDRVVSLDGKSIDSPNEAFDVMHNVTQGQSIEVTWRHDGQIQTSTVTPINENDYAYEQKRRMFGKKIPELSGWDINDKRVSVADFAGSVVVLNFWATWCGPCREELTYLQMMAEELSTERVVWINVSIDDDEKIWRRFVLDNRLSGIQVRAPEWASELFVSGFPTTFIIDVTGILRYEANSEFASLAIGLIEEHREKAQTRVKKRRKAD